MQMINCRITRLVYVISHTQGPVYKEGGTEGALVNRATRLTELPWEGYLLMRFFRKRIEAFTC